MTENIRKFTSIFHSPGLTAVWRWTKSVHRKVVIICLLTVVTTICSLGFTIATKGLVDGAVSSNMHDLRVYGILLGVLILARHALSALRALLNIKASSELQKSLQEMLVRAILSRDYPAIKGFHSGELVNRVFSDMNVIKGGVMGILPNILNIVVSFVGAAAILIAMDWHFVILMLIGGVLSLILVLAFRTPMKQRHKRMQAAEGALHASAQETLENIRLIKASVSEERAMRQIRTHQETLKNEQVRQGMFSFRMNDSMGLVFDFSWLFCMIWGCLNIYRGNLTYGSLAAMLQLIGRIQSPIASSVSIASQVYSVSSSAERLLELTDLPEEPGGEPMSDFDEIVLDDITFKYDDGVEEVLQSINWTIRKGDFMALTGMSGGGKTSLFQLLLGIYQPTSGRILFRLWRAQEESGRHGLAQKRLARERSVQPGTAQRLPAREKSAQSGTARGLPGQEGSVQSGTAQKRPAREGAVQPELAQRMPAREVSAQSELAQRRPAREGSMQAGTAQRMPGEEESVQSGTAQKRMAREGSVQPGTAQQILEVPASRGTRFLFAYVPQGNTLFSGTLRDNLTMFTDSADEEQILAAAKAACIDHVVKDIGLDAVLGERGIGLSEGQAQRVAIARALLSGAPILLLDEATSALDEKTEAKLLANISAMRDKTCIIVTHRRAALAICDYTLHIADGKMTQEES